MTALARPVNGMSLTQNTTFAPGVYHLTEPITIDADGVVLDGGGAVLIGENHTGSAVLVRGRSGVTIRNLEAARYFHALAVEDSWNVTVERCRVRDTHEISGPDVFIDIWRPAENAYGAAAFLHNVQNSKIADNDFQHNQNGVLMYDCRRVTVSGNNASFCSGFGVHLFSSSDNIIADNICDHVNRVYRRPNGSIFVGADAAGLLIVHNSCCNQVLRNAFRCGGDGIFLAGLGPQTGPVPCDDNLFEDNDCSLSPNNAIEATFSRGNAFRRNKCSESNYGFWGGYSWETIFEDNECRRNRIAGIAIEHGQKNALTGNIIEDNPDGILLWTRPTNTFGDGYLQSAYSGHYKITGNQIRRNRVGLNVEAQGESEEARDYDVTGNTFEENVWAMRLRRTRDVRQADNHISGSIMADEG